MKTYPYSFHVALDGNGINGLEGMAGVCIFRYDPTDGSYAYKVQYYDGVAGGHALSINPNHTIGFLGNAGQHLLLYDAQTLAERDRISTLRFEMADSTIRGSTHAIWLNNEEFITAIGDYFYRFHVNHLAKGEKLGPHQVKLAHGMKRTPSGRYLCYGSMDHPHRGEAREIGIWDLQTGEARRVELPTTCWHLVCHPTCDRIYAVSFRVLPQDYQDYHEWAMAFFKEYVFEIDAPSGQVLRHWACSRETPAHINSDVTISDRELIFCNGGSQSIVFVGLDDLATFRIIDERPTLSTSLRKSRQIATQMYDVLCRGSFFTSNRHILGALRVSRFSLIDSIHACQLSRDQTLLFTANRGLNHITLYDYPSNQVRLRVPMPDLQHYVPGLSRLADPRLGFHHGYLLSP